MHAELLFQHGYRSVREVADAALEELFEVEGLSQDQASEIHRSAKDYAEKMGDLLDQVAEVGGDAISDLERLPIPADIREMLVGAGFKTIQAVVEADDEALKQVSGIEEGDIAQIRAAVENFLRTGSVRPAPSI
jgi:transcription termination factor NusA